MRASKKTPRRYTLKRRAEQQARTRQRIVEAAVELHGSVGPARTTLSMVAERAGVQRNTLYAHFPEEWDLLLACSGLVIERDPLPDAAGWRAVADAGERLRTGLRAVYDWYARNADVAGCVLRDAEAHEPTRRANELRMGPGMRGWHDVLADGCSARQRAMLGVALDFFAWRRLTREGGLDNAAAAEAMARSIEAL